MARPAVPADKRITPYQSRVARQRALREAGGWIGTVELTPAAAEALRALKGDRSINETISAALIAANKKSPDRKGRG